MVNPKQHYIEGPLMTIVRCPSGQCPPPNYRDMWVLMVVWCGLLWIIWFGWWINGRMDGWTGWLIRIDELFDQIIDWLHHITSPISLDCFIIFRSLFLSCWLIFATLDGMRNAQRTATGRTTRHRGHGCGAQTHLPIGVLPQGHEKRRGIAFAMQHLGDFKPPIWTYPWRWSLSNVCVFFPVQERCSKLIDLLPV